jgi:hypothetical protein
MRKTIERHARAQQMQRLGMATHYTNDINTITNEYQQRLENSQNIV